MERQTLAGYKLPEIPYNQEHHFHLCLLGPRGHLSLHRSVHGNGLLN